MTETKTYTPDLSVKIAGVELKNPVMTCSGTFGSGEEYPLILSRVSVAPTFGSAVGNIAFPMLAESPAGFDAVFVITLISVALVLLTSILAIRPRMRAYS